MFGLVFLAVFTTTASCLITYGNYIGLEVPASRHIPLASEGVSKGNWQSEDIRIEYRYQTAGTSLEMEGTIDFSSALKNFTTLEHFYLWIHFIGPDNRILTTHEISPQVYFFEIVETSFKTVVALPPDAVAFVFSYSGYATEGGGGGSGFEEDGATDWTFWQTPHG
jgi:hypothetical protein